MASLKELARDLELAIAEHRKTFGQGRLVIRQRRETLRILLWDHRLEIMRALQIAANVAAGTDIS